MKLWEILKVIPIGTIVKVDRTCDDYHGYYGPVNQWSFSGYENCRVSEVSASDDRILIKFGKEETK